MRSLAVVLVLVAAASAHTLFSDDFQKFLDQKYPWLKDSLLANNIKGITSFGGGRTDRRERPIVLIHGLRTQAGSLWKVRKDFVTNNYPIEKLFATTYGPGESQHDIFNDSLKCEFVKKIRNFIVAVSEYSNSKVDVIAYSMGSPLTRKAILGGKCADTKEDIGGRISDKVHTYISVAGANHGSYLCLVPTMGGICDMKKGLFCQSDYIKDINSVHHYEGENTFSIASTGDEVVGSFACGRRVTSFKGAKEVVIGGKNHNGAMFETTALQLKIIRDHQ